MILFDGKTYESSEQDRLLTELEKKIPEILSKQQLSPEVVIDAVEQLRVDLLKGKLLPDAKKLINLFIKMIKREKLSAKEKKLLGDCAIFENVSNMPARVKCALLSWHTMESLLSEK